uniref:Endonuclease/exonuclease/phosphatase domain-containing protein n=1 Tax=Latimeria chalumnae TaxID=7897 RepID=H3AQN9_LATCH
IIRLIQNYQVQHLQIGTDNEDWNGVWNPHLDRLGPLLPSDGRISRGLWGSGREIGLIDVWRPLHPERRDYTFFSIAHNSYCRLDFFLVSQVVALESLSVEIHGRVLSDHSPMTLKYLPAPHLAKHTSWKLSNSLLGDKGFCSQLKKWRIQLSKLILWDTFKGWLISYTSHRKKNFNKQWAKLETELEELEKLHKKDPKSKEVLGRLKNKKTEFALFKAKKKFFISGNKVGKLLGHRLRIIKNASMISEIQSSQLRNPSEIAAEFRAFYEDLYSSEMLSELTGLKGELKTFLSDVELPYLSEEGIMLLGNRITNDESSESVISRPAGTSG